ncbi:hypothetical protein CC78DRAFT_534141 [Lojkania enalia]|uniref:Protein kinase domain-containing protein n=1 Tax=Lojkania enalia TaxID=147567 RepID=A0A9P4N7Y4_9PLEO|nr:hypothetical protein CC78DRAFT_534141 [Didymosphaeria enalia]
METISRLPRRLTQLYSDTKTSCDAVIEQDTPDTQPEVNALHRKYRIQKDRLITWGLEWSDNTKGKQGDIDESVERAGLTETVTSVLGTIKDILDEAERMHPPAVTGAGIKTLSGEKSGGGRPSATTSWAASDRSRYEDLAKDLTTSIDILYDLSRQRRTSRDGARGPSLGTKSVLEPPKAPTPASVFLSSEYNASDLTLVNPATIPFNATIPTTSTRANLPPKLDPADLVLPQEEPPPYESVGVSSSIRVIGKLRSRISSTNPWKTDGSKTLETPVLVEYATYDATYRSTGVPPPIERLEKLLSILDRLSNEQSFHGTLTCLGYFEDPRQPRFGLVFDLPSSVYSSASDYHKAQEDLRPVTLLSVLQTGSKSLHNSNSATPPLEDRFRLATTLALTFSKIHADHFVHKDVNSSNILVFPKNRASSANTRALQYALRSPIICSFDLFSEFDIDPTNTMQSPNIYRHPEDPKCTSGKASDYGPQFDLYSLGLILLEIGLWLPLSDLWKTRYTLTDFKQRIEEVYIRRLASKCGTAYMQVVRDCFWAADRIASGVESLQNFSQVYNRILIRLQRCCLLDEVDPSFEWGEFNSAAASIHKRKGMELTTPPEIPSSPSFRSPKRWVDKGVQILERSKSVSKPSPRNSPNLSSLSRSGSTKSIRKSISHSLDKLMSPKEEFPTFATDWAMQPETGSLADSATLVPSKAPSSPTFAEDRGEMSASDRDEKVSKAAIAIQRAWRASRTDSFGTLQRSMSFKDYKDKITLIQTLWRQRTERRNTIQALVNSSTHHWPQVTRVGLPKPEPEEPEVRAPESIPQNDDFMASNIRIETNIETPPRPKLRLHPIKFSPIIIDEWHTRMLPRLERLIERALKDADETISIDLVAIGETQATTRPTIFVTCTSVPKVKAILSRRFKYDENTFDLKVRRGKVRRSKLNRSSRRRNPPHRSMVNPDNHGDLHVMNPYHQERPICGASIGAFRGEHLPPVSYGGVILVDDEPLGMSVHHLLDAPSDDESDSEDGAVSPNPNDAILSSAANTNDSWLMGMGSQPGVQIAPNSPAPMWGLEISDDEDLKDEEDDQMSWDLSSDSEFDSDEESEGSMTDSITSRGTTGDIEGIPVGEGDEIKITQPAIDDVEDDFFPNLEDRDDDHLSSHELGYVHASSGIRRWKRDGIVHEIDWALLKLKNERLQPYNLVQGGRNFSLNRTMEQDQQAILGKLEKPVCRRLYTEAEDEYPNGIAKANTLGGMQVHCFGRTTGLQGGMVGAVMSSVRIYRRKTFSRSWHVVGSFGVGGDSGAWVIQNQTHRVVGHVLAWCERNCIAYICPMEVLVEDIKRTLGAKRIYLPGSVEETLYHTKSLKNSINRAKVGDSRVEEVEVGIEGLGIVDSAVDMGGLRGGEGGSVSSVMAGGRRSRLELVPIQSSGESDKENLPVLRSRLIKVRDEGRSLEVGMGMVGVP